jgi:hypothetical protein
MRDVGRADDLANDPNMLVARLDVRVARALQRPSNVQLSASVE